MRNINDVRFDLKQWGDFWSRQEQGQGYASKSNVEQLRETLQTGCSIQGTGHLISHCADNMHVPDHISVIDKLLHALSPKCKMALRQRYINKGRILYFSTSKEFLFWVGKAERELL